MENKHKYIFILALILGLNYTQKGLTHGSNIEYIFTKAINIKATYENGDLIKNGQVTVYNPSDPANPWLKGFTNEKGEFIFIPDYSITGNWEVKVRQAGHGNIITIPINQDSVNDSKTETTIKAENEGNNNVKSLNLNNTKYTIQQKLIMAGFGIWGCVGTALYFSRKKAEQ